MKYYLSPKEWNSSGYREVYEEEELKDIPEGWDPADCYYIGIFDSYEDAVNEAKSNSHWAGDIL